MEAVENKEQQKLSYEQLENVANQLSQQNNKMREQGQKMLQALQEANLVNFYKRLDYLWQVITTDCKYISEEFKQECGNTFMEMMFPKQEEVTETPETQENSEEKK